MQKFLFERSFDPEVLEAERQARLEEEQRRREAEAEAERRAAANEPDPEPEPEPEPPAPTFSEEDMEAARQDAFSAGRRTGEADALQSTQAAILACLKSMTAQTADVARRQTDAIAGLGDTAVQVALAVCSTMLPQMIRKHGGDEIESLIRQCLADLMDEPRFVVRVGDALLDDIRDRVNRLKAETGYEGAFVLLADDGLAPGDCRVEWADGGAERLGNQVWREIEQVISRLQASELSEEARQKERPERAAPDIGPDGEQTVTGRDPAGPETNAPDVTGQ